MPGGQHVAMVTIGGYDLIAFFRRHLHADHDSFLTDIKVTEAADETHAIHLTRLFFKAANQKHLTICVKLLLLIKFYDFAINLGTT